MKAESKEARDVDALFSRMGASERPSPGERVHSAVTMRPAPERLALEIASSAVGTPVTISATTTRAPPLSDATTGREVPQIADEAAGVPSALLEPLGVVRGARGVQGYVVRDADGGSSSRGAVDARFGDRVAYLARLASLVGEELGLEGLREVHVLGVQRRIAVVLAWDGSSLAVTAAVDTPLDDLGTRKR